MARITSCYGVRVPPLHDFLGLPEREAKPRQRGLTHVMDKGMSPAQIEGLFATAGVHVDIVKLGWGTSYVTQNLPGKLELYRSFGVDVVCGGTLLEVAEARGRLDAYRRWLSDHGFPCVEVSDGTIDMARERKLEIIDLLARDFRVLSEVGSKDAEAVFAPYQWVEWIREERAAGAWKVITEARESGTAGIFRGSGEVRSGLIDEIAHEIEVNDLIFEAPQKAQQAWFIRHLGPDVNLGNIPPEEVIPLETLRLGLRSDTMADVLDVTRGRERAASSPA
jgi:phosphosulfolactate synthase